MKNVVKQKLSFEDLLSLQTVIDSMLVSGELSLTEHATTWKQLLIIAGCDDSEYERLIDERWDRLAYIDAKVLCRSRVRN